MKTEILRPGDKMLLAVTFPEDLDDSESCHQDIFREDFLANPMAYDCEVHSILARDTESKGETP